MRGEDKLTTTGKDYRKTEYYKNELYTSLREIERHLKEIHFKTYKEISTTLNKLVFMYFNKSFLDGEEILDVIDKFNKNENYLFIEFKTYIYKLHTFKKGQKVTYVTEYEKEKGIIKNINEKGNVFVVYNCNNNLDNYENYTAELTSIKNLELGW